MLHILVIDTCRITKLFSSKVQGVKHIKYLSKCQSALRKPEVVRYNLNGRTDSGHKFCSKMLSPSLVLCGATSFCVVVLARLHHCSKILCEGPSRVHDHVDHDDYRNEVKFPWMEFFKLLLPDLWYLIGAVLVSM